MFRKFYEVYFRVTSCLLPIIILLIVISLINPESVSSSEVYLPDSLHSRQLLTKAQKGISTNSSAVDSVTIVALDTSATLRKKLWFEPKVLLTPDTIFKERRAQIIVRDSVILVSYDYVTDEINADFFGAVYSKDKGMTWQESSLHVSTGGASRTSLHSIPGRLFLAYESEISSPPVTEHIGLFRLSSSTFQVTDSLVAVTINDLNEYIFYPDIETFQGKLLMSFIHNDGFANFLCTRESYNEGISWEVVGQDILSPTYWPQTLLINGDQVSVIYEPTGDRVAIARSLDGGYTFVQNDAIADIDNYPSYVPFASTDGKTDIHVVWFDYKPPWAGFSGWAMYRNSYDAGETWGEIRSLSTVSESESVTIWSDTNVVVAAWEDARFGSPNLTIYLRYSFDRGQTWTPEIKIVAEADPAWEPKLYSDGDYLHMIWREQHPPDWDWGINYLRARWYYPGDVNMNGKVNVSDVTYLIAWLFGLPIGPEPPFWPAAQINGNGGVNISDLTHLISYLFGIPTGPPPVGEPMGL